MLLFNGEGVRRMSIDNLSQIAKNNFTKIIVETTYERPLGQKRFLKLNQPGT